MITTSVTVLLYNPGSQTDRAYHMRMGERVRRQLFEGDSLIHVRMPKLMVADPEFMEAGTQLLRGMQVPISSLRESCDEEIKGPGLFHKIAEAIDVKLVKQMREGAGCILLVGRPVMLGALIDILGKTRGWVERLCDPSRTGHVLCAKACFWNPPENQFDIHAQLVHRIRDFGDIAGNGAEVIDIVTVDR